MFTEAENNLADKAAGLAASLINVIPGDVTKKKEYLKLIADKITKVSELSEVPAEKPLKAISDNLTDTLHAIHAVLPDSEDPSKQRAKKRYKNSIGILNNILDLVGL